MTRAPRPRHQRPLARTALPSAPVVALLALSLLVPSSCGSSGERPPATTLSPAGPTATVRIGFLGALTGDAGPVGPDIENGEKLAISQFDAEDPPVRAALDAYDTLGDPSRARAGSSRLAADRTIAVIGPGDGSEALAAAPVLDQAGIPMIAVSATESGLAAHGWRYFHRVVADDAAQGHAAGSFLVGTEHASMVTVADDSSPYGRDLARSAAAAFGADGATVVEDGSIGARQLGPVSDRIVSSASDAVFFAGDAEVAAHLVADLRDRGYTGQVMVAVAGQQERFVSAAGPAADATYLLCGCSGTADNPKAQAFDAAYLAQFGSAPGPYAAEAYDATGAVLAAITSGETSPAAIEDYLAASSYNGITRTIRFQVDGDWAGDTAYVFKVEHGQASQFAVVS